MSGTISPALKELLFLIPIVFTRPDSAESYPLYSSNEESEGGAWGAHGAHLPQPLDLGPWFIKVWKPQMNLGECKEATWHASGLYMPSSTSTCLKGCRPKGPRGEGRGRDDKSL